MALEITLVPTDTSFDGSESEEVCSRCGKPFESVPLLLFHEGGAWMYRFHFGCVGMGAENDAPIDYSDDGGSLDWPRVVENGGDWQGPLDDDDIVED